MYYLYILKSEAEIWYYVGITDNPTKRLSEHNAGYTKSTKGHRPFDLAYLEIFLDKTAARKREIFIKKNHAAKKAIIDQIKSKTSQYGAIV